MEDRMRIATPLAVLFAGAGWLSAQESAGWVSLQGGSIKQATHSTLKASSTYGLGLGGWFTNRWGIEVAVLKSQIGYKTTELKGDETHAMLSGLFNFNPGGGTFFPFVRLGLGTTTFGGELKSTESSRRASYHGGLGVQGFFSERGMGFLEFREIRVGKNSPIRNEAIGLMGVGFRWGARERTGKAITAAWEPQTTPSLMVEALAAPSQAPPPVIALPAPAQAAPSVIALPPPTQTVPPVVALPRP
jgi:hypothetical protein